MAEGKRRKKRPPAKRRPRQRRQAQQAVAKKSRSKRRSRRALHYFLLLLFVIGVGAVVAFTSLFKIEDIVVLGADRYTPDEIAAVCGIQPGDHLLKVDRQTVADNVLKRFPYIKTVEIKSRLFPVRVELRATQAEPRGAILKGEEVVLIDESGKVLERGIVLVPEDVMVIKGIQAGDTPPGETLGVYNPLPLEEGEEVPSAEVKKEEEATGVAERLMMLRELFQAMEDADFPQITNVDLTDALNMRVNYENRITFELGSESQLVDKLRLIKLALEEQDDPEAAGIMMPDVEQNAVRFRGSTSEPQEEDSAANEAEEGQVPDASDEE